MIGMACVLFLAMQAVKGTQRYCVQQVQHPQQGAIGLVPFLELSGLKMSFRSTSFGP